MTISLRAVGTPTAATSVVTPLAPGAPAGLTATDLSILTVEIKGLTAGTAPTITTPSGWTLIGTVTNNGTLVAGADTGSNTIGMYYRVGTYTAPSITTTGADSAGAAIVAYACDASTFTWDVSSSTTGSDTTSGADGSITGAANLSINIGDWVVVGAGLSGDIGTVTAESLTATGSTFSSNTNRVNLGVTTNNDSRLLVHDWAVGSTGPSTAAPVYTWSNTSSTTGHARFVRIRAITPVSTLVDDFATADTAKWTFGAGATVTGGQASLTVASAYTGTVASKTTYDLTSSSVMVNVAQWPNVGNGSTELYAIQLSLDSANQLYIIGSNGTLTAYRKVGGTATSVGSVAIGSNKYVRIRHDGTQVIWEYGVTGTAWTQLGTAWTPTFAVTAMAVLIMAGYFGTEPSPGTALIESVNVVPVPTQSSALSATASATASITGGFQTASKALQATASGTATIQSAVSAVLRATASATVGFTAVTPIYVPPAPTPAPIVLPTPVRRMTVGVYTGNYVRLGQVPDYVSCSVTWQNLGVGSGTLVVNEDDPIAASLLTVDENVVQVVVDVGGVRWSGRVMSVTLEREGPVGSGVLTATLLDEGVWLQRMLASQNGASSSLASMPQYDTRTGPAVSVAADFINAAATRLGVPVRATKPAVDTSPSVTIKARMTTLADLLFAPLKQAGVVLLGQVWLPGDVQPADIGTALTTPTIVFRPLVLVDKPWLQWTDSMTSVTKMVFQGVHPAAYRAIVGLSGSDAARIYDSVINTTLQTSLGTFGLPEIYAEASDAALGVQSAVAGIEALAPVGGSASATFEVADAEPFSFGTDFVLGDMATIVVSGSTWRQQITKVTATDDRSGGLTITPVIGDETPDLTGDGMMIRALARVAEGVRALQAGR